MAAPERLPAQLLVLLLAVLGPLSGSCGPLYDLRELGSAATTNGGSLNASSWQDGISNELQQHLLERQLQRGTAGSGSAEGEGAHHPQRFAGGYRGGSWRAMRQPPLPTYLLFTRLWTARWPGGITYLLAAQGCLGSAALHPGACVRVQVPGPRHTSVRGCERLRACVWA